MITKILIQASMGVAYSINNNDNYTNTTLILSITLD